MQLGIPDHFVTVLGNRERNPAEAALHGQAILNELAATGVVDAVLVDPVGVVGTAAAWVDRDAVAVREALDQLLGTFGELVGVLFHVLRVNDEERLVIRIGVDPVARVGLEAGGAGRGRQAAGIGRDGAVCVSGDLGAPWGEGLAQFGWRDGCMGCTGCQDGHCQYGNAKFHTGTPDQNAV
ncbi:hypothetical protein D3C85_865560 [compost metagenome]